MSEDKDIMFNKAFCDGEEVNIEVESDKDIDVEFQGVLGKVEVKEELKNYHKADYSVAGFNKLTESRDGFTPIDEAMEEAGFFDDDDEVDVVNQPSHYTFSDKFEVIDIVEEITKHYPSDVAFAIGNVIKYVARSQHKNGTVDLEKARFYLDRAIDKLEKGE